MLPPTAEEDDDEGSTMGGGGGVMVLLELLRTIPVYRTATGVAAAYSLLLTRSFAISRTRMA